MTKNEFVLRPAIGTSFVNRKELSEPTTTLLINALARILQTDQKILA